MDRHRSRSRHRSQARALHPGLERRSLPVSGHRRGRLDARAEPCRGDRSRRARAAISFRPRNHHDLLPSGVLCRHTGAGRQRFAGSPVVGQRRAYPVGRVRRGLVHGAAPARHRRGPRRASPPPPRTASTTPALHQPVTGVPPVEDRAYIRELLQLAVVDDLLGPAGGPHERIVDMGVRDRYLVGKLAPRDDAQGGIEGLEGPLAKEDVEEPSDPIVPGQHEPGAEFGTATGRVEPESDGSDEIDTASNQSLVPSSFGMTFCVDGDVERIEVEACWGSYERVPNEEHELTRPNGQKAKVWLRIPCGGKLVLPLTEGVIPHRAPDANRPAVRIQGSVRAKNANGDRLVTLFLVNAQEEPDTNRDTAWLCQPELIVRAEPEESRRAISPPRPVLDAA